MRALCHARPGKTKEKAARPPDGAVLAESLDAISGGHPSHELRRSGVSAERRWQLFLRIEATNKIILAAKPRRAIERRRMQFHPGRHFSLCIQRISRFELLSYGDTLG